MKGKRVQEALDDLDIISKSIIFWPYKLSKNKRKSATIVVLDSNSDNGEEEHTSRATY